MAQWRLVEETAAVLFVAGLMACVASLLYITFEGPDKVRRHNGTTEAAKLSKLAKSTPYP